ncbi:GGDEF domain-containing protein [uncultured Variovorax sp.]|uniref:GGDEF domain-containing protein n=1 Tax=uncultured Variovorax sp. TaxID=114708 RepID=UPI0025D9126E|nr:GGDEF domain-containing protein [uncultured Variovorax sp.]
MRRIASANFLDLLLDAVCAVSADGQFVFANAAFERIFGYTAEEVRGRSMLDMVHPEDRARTIEAAARVMAGHLQLHFENRYIRKDGEVVHLRWTARWVEEAGLRVAVAHDITELHRTRSLQAALYAISEAAHVAQDLYDLFAQVHRIVGGLLDARHFSVLLFDDAQQALYPAFHAAPTQDAKGAEAPADWSWLAAALVGDAQRPSAQPEDVLVPGEWLAAALRTQEGVIGALALRATDGQGRYTAADAELLHFIAGQVATAVERKRLHVSLQTMAERDQLTQLFNRRHFEVRLAAAVARARERAGEVSVLFLDLDDFKAVNDRLGHAVGDLLLQSVADRLQACVRGVDVVARLGGDEFVVLLDDDPQGRGADTTHQRIAEAFDRPFTLCGDSHAVRVSIGVARFPSQAADAEQLLQRADTAMYADKGRAKSRKGGDAQRHHLQLNTLGLQPSPAV